MDREFERVVEDALELRESERHELVDRLNRSFSNGNKQFDENLAEAKRRLEAYDRGEIKSVDAHDAMARVRKLRAK
jgi:putative addiction module component (TIGR02574 family)